VHECYCVAGGLVRDDFGVGLSSTRPDSIPAKEYLSYIQAECPTFAELLQFKQSDDMLSFNCEVKYPSQLEKKQFSMFSSQFLCLWLLDDFFVITDLHVRERNFYVDLILKCIAEHAGPHRRIVFSSFDPDICTMLALKQSRYPVFFLTEAGGEIYCDPRLNSLHQVPIFVTV
jgi:glycerophosphoryl diester phosphodiesterase